ncbi:hypothetical protein [Treponema pedis]|uniref:hypothetical protein n=1 Tax=Treponema pedis TaxID=409322 RepID=UPI001267C8FF|nr:hypothetical protein [Treponema pedis]
MRAKLKLIEIEEEKAFFIYAIIIIDNVSERNGSFELQKIRLCHNEKKLFQQQPVMILLFLSLCSR